MNLSQVTTFRKAVIISSENKLNEQAISLGEI
jgi:hypothetical protein